MTCRHCIDDAVQLLQEAGFDEKQATALAHSRETVFLVVVKR